MLSPGFSQRADGSETSLTGPWMLLAATASADVRVFAADLFMNPGTAELSEVGDADASR